MLDVDYEDKDSTGQLKIGPGHWGVNFMQRVHNNLVLGFDYTNVVRNIFIHSINKECPLSAMQLKHTLKTIISSLNIWPCTNSSI